MQAFIVALIVAGCTGYAAWTLMPSAAQKALARALLRIRWPERIARVFRGAARGRSGCGGCDSCGDQQRTIKIHRR